MRCWLLPNFWMQEEELHVTECVAFYFEYPYIYIYTLYRVLPLPYLSYMCPPKPATLGMLTWGILTKHSWYLWRPVKYSPAPVWPFTGLQWNLHRLCADIRTIEHKLVCRITIQFDGISSCLGPSRTYCVKPIIPDLGETTVWTGRLLTCTICTTGLRGLFAMFP